jgi:DNA-binding HxlR family transcriptional regulator
VPTESRSQGRRAATLRFLLTRGESARTLDIIGDRWSLLILRDAFLGVRRFEEFRRRSGAPPRTLSARLTALERHGILHRFPAREGSRRLEYHLTAKGLGLHPVALCMWNWESRWGGEFGLPPLLVHRRCGKSLKPQLACVRCDEPVQLSSVTHSPGPGANHEDAPARNVRRRASASRQSRLEAADTTMFHSIDTVGDRWTALLVGALFLGLSRYDDISHVLGIATNILADRLRLLLSAGVIEQRLYSEHPPRHEYHLTTKGLDLFPFMLALHDWGSRWMPAAVGAVVQLRHHACRAPLRSRPLCGSCGEIIDVHDVLVHPQTPTRAKRRRTSRA